MARNEHKKVLQQLSEAYQNVQERYKMRDPDGDGSWPDDERQEEREKNPNYGEPEYEDAEETQQKFKIFFTTALNPDGEDAEGWISQGTDKEDAWDNLYTYFKNIPPGPGHRGRAQMSFYRVQIEPYEEGDPCADAMGPCQDSTAESEDGEGWGNILRGAAISSILGKGAVTGGLAGAAYDALKDKPKKKKEDKKEKRGSWSGANYSDEEDQSLGALNMADLGVWDAEWENSDALANILHSDLVELWQIGDYSDADKESLKAYINKFIDEELPQDDDDKYDKQPNLLPGQQY